MLTILQDIHYANVFMVGTQEDTWRENEDKKFWIWNILYYFKNMQPPLIYIWLYIILSELSELKWTTYGVWNIVHKTDNKVKNR